jgi:hypothetical protein
VIEGRVLRIISGADKEVGSNVRILISSVFAAYVLLE